MNKDSYDIAIEKVMEINSWINDLGSNELDKLKILILNWDI